MVITLQYIHIFLWCVPSVQFISVAQLCPTLCDPMDCSTLGLPVHHSWSLLKLMSIESMMPSNQHILCYPLLLLLSVFPSIRVFFKESVLRIRWPKYWSFSFSISPSSEYSGLISFRIDWFAPCCPRDSQESSPTPQFKSTVNTKAQFFGTQLSLWSISHIYTWPLEKP